MKPTPPHLPKVPHLRPTPPFRARFARWVGTNLARLSYGRRIEPTWLEVNRLTIPVRDLPEPFEDFRVVHLSDLHAGRHVPRTFLEEAIDLALAQDGDVVVVTGDFVHKGYRHVDTAAKAVGRLRARHGVYAVLGNHDFSVRNALGFRRYRGLHKAVAEALAGRGVDVLRNRSVSLSREGQAVHLCGLDDLWSRECDPEAAFRDVPLDAPRLVLAHNPQTIHRLDAHRCDLMLSGHTHGGQVDWPGLGRLVLSRTARAFAAGLYRHRTSLVYVNKGVGFGFRFRFNVRPEVAVLTIRRV
jgi:predicted MPP superfamily phosphohydrolase